MSLILDGTVELNCDGVSFNLRETTSAYNIDTAPNGWGSPNITIGSVVSSTLVIENETTEVVYDDIAFTNSSTYNNLTLIELEDLLIDDEEATEIEDGIWSFTLTVVGASTTYTLQLKIIVVKTLKCSLFELAKRYASGNCSCSTQELISYLTIAYAKWISLNCSTVCGSESSIENQITTLGDYLESINCEEC